MTLDTWEHTLEGPIATLATEGVQHCQQLCCATEGCGAIHLNEAMTVCHLMKDVDFIGSGSILENEGNSVYLKDGVLVQPIGN